MTTVTLQPAAWRVSMGATADHNYWHYFGKKPKSIDDGEIWEPLYSASTLESLQRENEELRQDRDRTARNRDMWKGQVERQSDSLSKFREEEIRLRETLFKCGSFIADAVAIPELNHQEMSWINLEADSGYHLIDLEPSDVDLFFVYPWPGEDQFVQQLFEDSATPGAVLLAYLGADELACWQKTS